LFAEGAAEVFVDEVAGFASGALDFDAHVGLPAVGGFAEVGEGSGAFGGDVALGRIVISGTVARRGIDLSIFASLASHANGVFVFFAGGGDVFTGHANPTVFTFGAVSPLIISTDAEAD